MLKELRKLAYLSMALVALAYSPHSANAAITPVPAGACTGAAFSSAGGQDCVTTTGHISASVVSTLTINELRAISFGNMSVPCGGAACTGVATIVLNPTDATRTLTTGADAFFLLRGASANSGNPGTGNGGVDAGNINSGGQSPGILEVKLSDEGAADHVYISFASNAGEPVDFSGEDYWANDDKIRVQKGTAWFTVQDFVIDCLNTGNDVYGHYCDNGAAATAFQVKVGATLKTTAGASGTYVVGKYEGTYNAMVSY